MKQFEIRIPSVSFQMWKDGSLHFHVAPSQISMVQLALKELDGQLSRYAIELLEKEKKAEESKHALPPTRMQQLEAELAELKKSDAERKPQTIVTGGYEADDGLLGAPPATI